MQGARDETIWQFARDESLTLVSKDGDFHRLAVMKGSPPKFVWIRTGNCRTSEVVALLRRHRQEIAAFIEQEEATVLELG